jgi:PqqD family protein of HPr-rel-A system
MSNDVRLKELAISETGFVFDPHSGGTFTLNGTGQVIVKALRDGSTPDEIVEQLRATFDDVNRDVIEDVRDFLRTLTDFGLLSR